MKTFRNQFFGVFGTLLASMLIVLVVWTRATSQHLPPKPGYPVPGEAFVAEYSGVGADAAHLLYYWGLFGMDAAIDRADLLLLGSSHMQFGLSAKIVSERLSQAEKQKIAAFNLGLGCGETLRFDVDLLRHRRIENRSAIMDTYTYGGEQLTPCSESAESSDAVKASFSVLHIWSRFSWDWIVDGSLPSIYVSDDRFRIGRFLNGPVVIVDWRYGDVDAFYRPDSGEVFPAVRHGAEVSVLRRGGLPWTLPQSSIPVPEWMSTTLKWQHIKPVFTLIPYAETPHDIIERQREIEQYHTIENLLRGAGGDRAPFITLSARDLTSFDYGHLSGSGRAIASRRLTEVLKQRGLGGTP